MDSVAKDLLKELSKNKEYTAVMEWVKQYRPVVPEFKLQKTKDQQDFLIDQIKFQSGRREGFDFLMALLNQK